MYELPERKILPMQIDVAVNPVYLPYLNKEQFTQIFFGGSSSGKSYFICQKIVLDNMNGVNWLCCRNVGRTLRNSTFNEIVKAISRMGLGAYYSINRTDLSITCRRNDRQILFSGIDDVEKLKSITPKNGVLERIFIEEATETKYEAYKQLTKRLRGRSEHKKQIILAFNPILKSHWIYREFFGKWQDDKTVFEDENTLILKTTFRDNLFLTDDDRRLLENERDPYFYQVYSLGNWGVLDSVIFTNWRVEDLAEQKAHFDNIYNGLDFGYSSDPNALIRFHYDGSRKRIYVFDELYRCGMSDEALCGEVLRMVGSGTVICDSAEPKSIDYLASHGIYAYPAFKGPDSVNRGIRWLQGHEIIIDVGCQNFKNEIEQYHWAKDKYGNETAKPVDCNNHLIDALRYASEPLQSGSAVTFMKSGF